MRHFHQAFDKSRVRSLDSFLIKEIMKSICMASAGAHITDGVGYSSVQHVKQILRVGMNCHLSLCGRVLATLEQMLPVFSPLHSMRAHLKNCVVVPFLAYKTNQRWHSSIIVSRLLATGDVRGDRLMHLG